MIRSTKWYRILRSCQMGYFESKDWKSLGVTLITVIPIQWILNPLLVSRYDALPLSTTGRTLWRQHTSGIYVTSREESSFALTLPLSRLTHPAMNADSRLPQPDQAIIFPG